MTIFDQVMQEEYDRWGIHPPEHAWCAPEQTRREVEFLKIALDLRPSATILDLQCSWGRHALMLGAEGYTVMGVDISPTMIANATRAATRPQCPATFAVVDVRTMDYVSHFDVVYQIQSSLFEAWRPPSTVGELLRAVWNALKPRGQYVFGWKDDWNTAKGAEPRWRQILTKKGITTFDSCALPFYAYDAMTHTQILRDAGFTVLTMHNRYAPDERYDPRKPGLIIIARKE